VHFDIHIDKDIIINITVLKW